MIKTTLTAAALCILGMAPVSAASLGCSSPNLTKAETTVEQMPYSDARWASYREIMLAQNDLLAGNMRGCAAHIGRVMHVKAASQGL